LIRGLRRAICAKGSPTQGQRAAKARRFAVDRNFVQILDDDAPTAYATAPASKDGDWFSRRGHGQGGERCLGRADAKVGQGFKMVAPGCAAWWSIFRVRVGWPAERWHGLHPPTRPAKIGLCGTRGGPGEANAKALRHGIERAESAALRWIHNQELQSVGVCFAGDFRLTRRACRSGFLLLRSSTARRPTRNASCGLAGWRC